jgi:hypothetical protein
MWNFMETSEAPESGSSASDDAASSGPRVPKLSEELAGLKERSEQRALTFHETIEALGPRGYAVLVLILALPFAQPIPIPGLSTLFGLMIAHVAFSFVLGREPWVPKRFEARTIPSGFFNKVIRLAAWIIRLLEKRLHPRLAGLTDIAWLRRSHAGLMVIAGLILALPLPFPFTNSFPAWTIIFISAGLLERDGLSILWGYVAFAAGVFYFVFLGEATQRLVIVVKDWILSWW